MQIEYFLIHNAYHMFYNFDTNTENKNLCAVFIFFSINNERYVYNPCKKYMNVKTTYLKFVIFYLICVTLISVVVTLLLADA